jgi:hypothetical protein
MSIHPALPKFMLPVLLALATLPGEAAAFMIHGAITSTGAVLEPVWSVDHLAGEAPAPGPYTLAFLDGAGTVLHAVPFATAKAFASTTTGCDLVETGRFLVLVPMTEQLTARTAALQVLKDGRRLGELRSTAWGASAAPTDLHRAAPTDLHRAAPIVPGLEPRAVALGKDRVRIVWDALTHPAMFIYSGGEVLREAAGGCVDVTTASPRLTLKLSDNLRNLTFESEVKAATAPAP